MKIVIIGGGIAGCSAAIELANRGHKVSIIEGKNQLLKGSSNDTPCRLGLGFHYLDTKTAKKYLRATLEFVRQYPGFVLGDQENLAIDHPLRRGRYFITPDSLFNLGDINSLHTTLKGEYARLIKEDPQNKVFGEPENFSKVLAVDSYNNTVNTKKVVMGYETAEQTMDWPRFRESLIKTITNHENITLLTNKKVVQIHSQQPFQFTLDYESNQTKPHSAPTSPASADRKKNMLAFNSPFKRSSSTPLPEQATSTSSSSTEANKQTIHADFVINSSWNNIEYLNTLANIPANLNRVNRVKAMVKIELPANFNNDSFINSMFFCFGPHCAFTNTGNGEGFITYEPKTNLGASTDLLLPDPLMDFLDDRTSQLKKTTIAQAILKGVIQYIPSLKGAVIQDIKFGNVMTEGLSANINDPKSPIHKRADLGIKSSMLGWIDNPAMKLLYFMYNTREVTRLLSEHVATHQALPAKLNTLKTDHALHKEIIRNLSKHMQTYLMTDLLEDCKSNLAYKNKLYALKTDELSQLIKHLQNAIKKIQATPRNQRGNSNDSQRDRSTDFAKTERLIHSCTTLTKELVNLAPPTNLSLSKNIKTINQAIGHLNSKRTAQIKRIPSLKTAPAVTTTLSKPSTTTLFSTISKTIAAKQKLHTELLARPKLTT